MTVCSIVAFDVCVNEGMIIIAFIFLKQHIKS